MATQFSYLQRMKLAEKTRQLFLDEAGRAMVELSGVVQERLTSLMNAVGSSRDMQNRRDAWTIYQRSRTAWIDGTMKAWEAALQPQPSKKTESDLDEGGGFELVGTDVMENKILASRLVLAVTDKASSPLEDLRLRMKFLESRDELEKHDILRPEVSILLLVEQWTACGMPRDSWPMVTEAAEKLLIERLKAAYTNCNEFLIQQEVMPTIDLKDRVKRAPVGTGARSRPMGPGGQESAAADSQFQGDAGAQGGGWLCRWRPGPGRTHLSGCSVAGRRRLCRWRPSPGRTRLSGCSVAKRRRLCGWRPGSGWRGRQSTRGGRSLWWGDAPGRAGWQKFRTTFWRASGLGQ